LQAGRCSAGPHKAGVSVRVRGLQLSGGQPDTVGRAGLLNRAPARA